VNFALSAIGRDRPGIVAAISEALLELGGNIDDSQMSILHGHFAVMLIVSVPDVVGRDDLGARLEPVARDLGLEGIAVNEIDELSAPVQPTHVLSVYGADHPGIVHAVSAALAERGIDITDLRTRRTGEEGSPVYVMMMELAVPGEAGDLEAALEAVGEQASVDLTLRELGTETF
jgi:glycine cleavage system transcriptional repressor